MPFVVEKTMTSVSSSHGAPVLGSRVPPHRSTTFSPRKYTAQAAPSSARLRKFSSNAARTGSNPGATDPFTTSIAAPMFAASICHGDPGGDTLGPRSMPDPRAPDQLRSGLWLAFWAYAIWGLLTLYWKALAAVPAVEQLIWRGLGSAIFMLGLLAARKRLSELRPIFRDPTRRNRLLLSAALLAVNWFVFLH